MHKLILLTMALLALPAQAFNMHRCAMPREGGIQEKISLLMDNQLRLAGFIWTFYHSPERQCRLSADTFREVSPERYVGAGGCELQTWRQGARQTLAVISQESCLAAYCTARMRPDILGLPIAVDLRTANCSD